VVRLKVPELNPKLAAQAVDLVQSLRAMDLRKSPSISETLDWAKSLVSLNVQLLDADVFDNTMSTLLKHEIDLKNARRRMSFTSEGVQMDNNDFNAFRWSD